jgi:hypothetical protein
MNKALPIAAGLAVLMAFGWLMELAERRAKSKSEAKLARMLIVLGLIVFVIIASWLYGLATSH